MSCFMLQIFISCTVFEYLMESGLNVCKFVVALHSFELKLTLRDNSCLCKREFLVVRISVGWYVKPYSLVHHYHCYLSALKMNAAARWQTWSKIYCSTLCDISWDSNLKLRFSQVRTKFNGKPYGSFERWNMRKDTTLSYGRFHHFLLINSNPIWDMKHKPKFRVNKIKFIFVHTGYK
jgi:hypothetical protein